MLRVTGLSTSHARPRRPPLRRRTSRTPVSPPPRAPTPARSSFGAPAPRAARSCAGEARVCLDRRSEAQQVLARERVAQDDRMRVAHATGTIVDPLPRNVEHLVVADRDDAELLSRPGLAAIPVRRGRAPPVAITTSAARSPAAATRAAIRMPLPDISAMEPSGFQMRTTARASSRPVTSSTPCCRFRSRRRTAGGRARRQVAGIGPLDDQVRVPERMPLLEAHRGRLPLRGRRSRLRSLGGPLASTGTSPGIRLIHFRWYAA